MSEDRKLWRTDNMSLAGYLILQGQEVVKVGWEEGTRSQDSCFWHFDESPELSEHVADYVGGMALVEPQEYNRIITNVKNQMFDIRKADKRRSSA